MNGRLIRIKVNKKKYQPTKKKQSFKVIFMKITNQRAFKSKLFGGRLDQRNLLTFHWAKSPRNKVIRQADIHFG